MGLAFTLNSGLFCNSNANDCRTYTTSMVIRLNIKPTPDGKFAEGHCLVYTQNKQTKKKKSVFQKAIIVINGK